MRKRIDVVAAGRRRRAVAAAADDGTAWFGTPGPAPLSDPRKPVMKYDDVFAPLPAQFAHRPGKFDELLDAAALKADQKRIVGFSLESLGAGDKVWGRRAATPAFMHTIEWTVSEMKAAGLKDARVETFAVPGADVGAAVVAAADRRRSGVRRRHADGDAAVGVSAAGRRVDSRRHADRAGRLRRPRHRRGSGGPRSERQDRGRPRAARSRRCSAPASRASRRGWSRRAPPA